MAIVSMMFCLLRSDYLPWGCWRIDFRRCLWFNTRFGSGPEYPLVSKAFLCDVRLSCVAPSGFVYDPAIIAAISLIIPPFILLF
jgi:hypothetical protein